MADENNVQEHGGNAEVSTLDALHLDGKGLPGLEDADEQNLPDTSEVDGEDVKGFANVQSAQRTTFEKMQQGAPPQEGAIPVGDRVIPDIYTPSEPDNNVEARFSNPFPAFTPEPAPAEEEARPAAEAETPRPEEPVLRERPIEEALPGDDDRQGRPTLETPRVAVEPVPEVLESVAEDEVVTEAQEAGLVLADAKGVEDQPTKLNIQITTQDADGGGDRLAYISIAGIPDYFVIVDGAGNVIGQRDGDTWRLSSPTADQIKDLWLKNLDTDDDADFSGSFALRVTVGTIEPNGSTAVTSNQLNVTIAAVADTPDVAVKDSAGMEETWIGLTINIDSRDSLVEAGAAANGAETQTIYISGVPAGAQLNHGTRLDAPLVLEDGTTIPAGSWVVQPADLADLAVKPPANDSHDFTLTVRVASVEASNGDTAVSAPLTIQVDVGVVAPSASGSGVGNEDEWQALTLSANVNLPDGTENLTVFLKDLPADVQLAYGDGTPVPMGADGRYEITGRLDDLKVRWNPDTQAHTDADISFKLVAEVRDGDTDLDSAAIRQIAPDFSSVEVPVTVIVKAVADAPTLSASAVGVEDQWFDLKIDAALVDRDGSETLTVTVTGPTTGPAAGFQLSAGTQTAPGVWSLSQADLVGLKIKPAQDSDADFSLTIDATATEAATGAQVAVKSTTTTRTITVEVLSDADVPGINVIDGPQHVNEDTFFDLRTLVGNRLAVLGDLNEVGGDDGEILSPDLSETLSFEITAKQAGSRIWIDGQIQTMDVDQTITLSAADVFAGKVRVGGPADWSSTTEIHFDLRTKATDTNDDAREAALEAGGAVLDRSTIAYSALDRLTLVIDPVHDQASLVATNAGTEDETGGIAVTPVVTFTDADMSERPTGTVTFTSTDVDLAGGRFELNGVAITLTEDNGTYSWSVPSTAFTQAGNTWTLSGLQFFPKAHLAEDVSYTISVPTQDVAGGSIRTLTATGTITVEAVADTPTVTPTRAWATESATGPLDIPLTISAATPDNTDGSETLFVYVGNLPAGASLNHVAEVLTSDLTVKGVTIPASAGSPVYKIAAADLADLKLTVPQGFSDDLALSVWSTTTEARNGDMAVTGPQTLLVDIGVVAPSASGAGTGNEDEWITLTLAADINADDGLPGTESLRVFIEDLPAGVELASVDGTTTFQTVTYKGSDGLTRTGIEVTGNLTNVKVRWTEANKDADFTFNLRAIAYDQDADAAADMGGFDRATAIDQAFADSADVVVPVTVVVKGVADAPTLSASAVGVEDKFAALNISSVLTDTDGSETLTVTISGLPAGLTLHQGTTALVPDGSGNYVISANNNADLKAMLADLRIYGLAANSNTDSYGAQTSTDTGHNVTDFTLNVTAVAADNDNSTRAATPVTVNVKIYGDADTPVAKVVHGATQDEAVSVLEDTFYNLKNTLLAVSGEDGTDPVTLAIKSADGSETLTFTITSTRDGSRVLIDKDGDGKFTSGVDELKVLNNGQTLTVTAADIAANKVLVTGPSNWAAGEVEFKITPTATESDDHSSVNTSLTASNGFDTNPANDLSRNVSADGVTRSLWLKMIPDADATTITASGGGLEDSAGITFEPKIQLNDTDGSETLTGVQLLIKGSMEGQFKLNGTTLTAADSNGDGVADTVTVDGTTYTVYNVPISGATGNSYTVSGLTYVPNANSDADVTYRIRTYTQDSSTTGTSTYPTVSGEGTIVVKAVADAPSIAVGTMAATTTSATTTAQTTLAMDEDGYLKLDLTANLTDTDGSEFLSAATLTKVPAGWSVVYQDASSPTGYTAYAYNSAKSTWTLDVAKLDNVYLHPPKDSDADAALITFNVTSREKATGSQVETATRTTSVAFDVVVNPVADTPNLLVSDARVLEDNLVKLDIRPALTDTDTSETLTVQITDTQGGTFWYKAANGTFAQYDGTHVSGGTWTFTTAEVKNLYFQPKANSNDDVSLSVSAVSVDRGVSTAVNTQILKVIVTGVADPSLVPFVDAEQKYIASATGTEGNVIDPSLESYVSVDTDGSESLSAVISGIPEGVTLFLDADGDNQLDNGEANSGFLKYIGNGRWSVDPDHVGQVRLLAPKDYSGTFELSVTLITTENDGDYKAVPATLRVTVNPVADAPTGSLSGSANEDADFVAFTLTANVADLGGGNAAIGAGGVEAIHSITNVTLDVTELVAANGNATNVFVRYNGTDYTAVADGAGHYTITIPSVSVPTGQTSVSIGGLVLHGIPDNYSKDVSATMTVTAVDGSGATASYASAPVSGKIAIHAVADEPALSVKPDTDGTPAVHDYVTTGSTHTVTLVGADGGAVARVTDTDGSESLYVVVKGVPNGVAVEGGINNGDGSWTLPGGTSVSSIKLVAGSAYARTDADNNGVADNVTLTIKAVVTDVDPDGGSDTEDAQITVAVNFGDFGGGSGGTPTTIPEGRIDGSLTGTEDQAISLAALKSMITVFNDQGNADPADDQTLTVNSAGVCSDGSTVSVVVAVPAGWTIGGSGHYLIDSANGVSTYTVPYSALESVTLTPPDDFSGVRTDVQMRVVVTTADGRYDSSAAALTSVPINVNPDADGAAFDATLQSVVEDDGTAAISITLTPTDGDYSESLSTNEVTIRVHHEGTASPGTLTGSGSGYTIGAGVNHGTYTDYKVTLTNPAAFKTASGLVIGGLAFDSANDYSGTVRLSVIADVTDSAVIGGVTKTDTTSSSVNLSLNVASQVDTTTFALNNSSTLEDQAVNLQATITHSDLIKAGTQWASETMSVVIKGVPNGATLSGAYNNGDGSWTVYDANLTYNSNGTVVLTNVKYIPAPNDSSDVSLRLVTYTKEADGTTWTEVTSSPFTVVVRSDADGATINPQAVSGTEDQLCALQLGAQVADTSESAIITITGVPFAGAITDALGNAVGSAVKTGSTWTVTLSADEVKALDLLGNGQIYFKAPAYVSGSWSMAATIASVDVDADTIDPVTGTNLVDTSTTTSAFTFTVSLAADANAPTLTVNALTLNGTEDSPLTLNLSTALVDTDGSESVSLTLSGAPVGTVFQSTTNGTTWTSHVVGAGGSVTIAGAVTNVKMVPPADFNGTITIQATATATESSNADVATTSQTITVSVAAVNDAPTLSLTGVAGLGIEAGNHANPILLMGTANLTIADVENDAITGMSLSVQGNIANGALGLTGITPVLNGQGDLVVTVNGKTFVVEYESGVLSFSGAGASYADYKALLTNHVIFTSSTGSLGDGTGKVVVTVTDDEGGTSAGLEIPVTVDLAGSATPTTMTGDALGDVRFTGDGMMVAGDTVSSANAPIALAGGIDIAGGSTMTGMTVSLDGLNGDTLALSGVDISLGSGGGLMIANTNVSVVYQHDANGPSLVFSGTADSSVYDGILGGIVLSSSAGNLAAGERSLSVTLFDQNGQGSDPLTATTRLSTNLTLMGDNLGDVRWGADGSATVDDIMIVQYGDPVGFIDGLGGNNTLMMQANGADGDWIFQVNGDHISATSASDPQKSFDVYLDQGSSVNTSLTTQDTVVFNGDASGRIEFDNTHSLQFDNIDRLVG